MKAWIDVGGTFTDCFVVDEHGIRRRTKVLSSGATKGSVHELRQLPAESGGVPNRQDISQRFVYDPLRQGECDNFWAGFDFHLLNSSGQVEETIRIERSFGSSGILQLANPLSKQPQPGATYEIRSELEAPVLAVRRLLDCPPTQNLPPLEVRLGTTRGTNALLTRSGRPVGLLVTAGFGDCLRIGTQERTDLFSLAVQKPLPLTELVIEIPERLAADGSLLVPLDEQAARSALHELWSHGIRSLAICLLHAYRNPNHEQRLAELARELGFTDISLSHEVAPFIKLVARAETTTLDAYLNPILDSYVARVWDQFGGPDVCQLRLMTSGGQLVRADKFRGRDSILSGPAGGVVALASLLAAIRSSQPQLTGVIGFDMGGTSTDVSRCEGTLVRQFETRKAGVRVLTPTMAIHTVAAGGGSICRCEGGRLLVGPESAGSDPGPACYGRGGPLTVTDLNLILGRVAEDRFPFPLSRDAALQRLCAIQSELAGAGVHFASEEALAEGFWNIAVHHMAEAVRTVTTAEGADPRRFGLVSFGGAAGQHACAVAAALDITSVVDHPDASVFSALGMGLAPIGRITSRGIYRPLDSLQPHEWQSILDELREQAVAELRGDVPDHCDIHFRETCDVRYQGTETSLEIEIDPIESLAQRFDQQHLQVFGYMRENRSRECVAIRVEAEYRAGDSISLLPPLRESFVTPVKHTKVFCQGQWWQAQFWHRETLPCGAMLVGPAVVASQSSTLVIEPGWRAVSWNDGTWMVQRQELEGEQRQEAIQYLASAKASDRFETPVQLEILASRLQGIAEQMGEVLRRTAVSVNVKERLDYSCAIFRGDGTLVAGAMHVPVHLGAMGHTVRNIMQAYPQMAAGDCYLSNDPYAGGSHLPDVTAVTPVFVGRQHGQADFFVASRAHHAEIGGIAPGSMPPNATCLAEEGVVIRNFALVRDGVAHWEALEQLLAHGPYPSRNPQENLADIAAQIAAGQRGVNDLVALAHQFGVEQLDQWMSMLLELAAEAIEDCFAVIGEEGTKCSFKDWLDDITQIQLTIERCRKGIVVDFAGTSDVHPRGWNATPAIVTAAILYCLRCLSHRNLPLSEGILRRIELRIPAGLLNPPSNSDPARCPAVVAGNVETSQRIVDCFFGALGVAAASQGTMNNLLIGDATFGYYETICGGAGATANAAGASAVHTHMTNTRITDPEVLELRYPLRLHTFAVRRGSGGAGKFPGGDGVTREIEMLAPLTVSLLTSRRGLKPPYGCQGGQPGASGKNLWIHSDGTSELLPAVAHLEMLPGDRIRIETPGGGGFGTANSQTPN